MIVGHFSDLHGRPMAIGHALHIRARVSQGHPAKTGYGLPDVWVDSGDFFPNTTRGDVAAEQHFQTRWFEDFAEPLVRFLGGVPLLSTPGNHDYVSLAELLAAQSYPAHALVHPDGTPRLVELLGQRWVGLRQIPWIAGEWAGEVHDLRPMTEMALDLDPTILVAHCPPAGALDGTGYDHIGNPVLATQLAYRPHRVTHVLTGHVHERGGRRVDVGDPPVRVVNGATTVSFFAVPG